MISQEEFRKAILENKWEKISKLSDDEIIELVSYGEGEEAISAQDAMAIIDKVRRSQEVSTKLLILKGKEVELLKGLLHNLLQPLETSEELYLLIEKIMKS